MLEFYSINKMTNKIKFLWLLQTATAELHFSASYLCSDVLKTQIIGHGVNRARAGYYGVRLSAWTIHLICLSFSVVARRCSQHISINVTLGLSRSCKQMVQCQPWPYLSTPSCHTSSPSFSRKQLGACTHLCFAVKPVCEHCMRSCF